ncbi:somatomedin-B and thrombospondin type-1 domain-containing protein [Hydra vulgaris]|uniref:RPE-spondin n=1 Tax=Hydra vulgaris TaxID=6087 RepID=T2MA82_HYDVU|nr:somatomedin-B and thrombospondin type-1 domain-containing protein [Hydra vulgaris]
MFSQNLVRLLVFLASFITICQSMCDQRPYGGKMMCCTGKDAQCFVKMENNRTPGRTNAICYCDSHCKFTDDCCQDYDKIQKLCQGAIDCEVSEWGDWGNCSSSCGSGVMNRRRKITQMPSNGGKTCPILLQTRGCNTNNVCKDNYESALILPTTYRRQPLGEFMFENILPVEKSSELTEKQRISPTYSYCVHYRMSYKRSSCENTWADSFISSVPVCAECQSRVMNDGRCRGEGSIGVKTRWKALGLSQCQGDWIRLGPIIPNCTCDENGFSNFVFV